MKKTAALIMALLFILSLGACSKQAAQSSPYVGKWKLESYDTQEQQSKVFYLFAHMELKDDGSFIVTGHTVSNSGSATVDSNPKAERPYVNGTYTTDGNELKFIAKQHDDGYGMKPMDEEVNFTGKIADDGKLNCLISDHEVIFVKE